MKILIVEDNRDVNEMLAELLREQKYEVSSAYDGVTGMRLLESEEFDLVLLDIMLPYLSGDEILKRLRQRSELPVIVISAKDLVSTKVDMLRLGADDYITKPFDLAEVLARVEAQLRRRKRDLSTDKRISYKDLVLNQTDKTLEAAGAMLELTAKEYSIMELLLTHTNKMYSKANIYELVWGEEYLGDDNAIKTHISNLRNKLKKANPNEEYIETVWGMGYRLMKTDIKL